MALQQENKRKLSKEKKEMKKISCVMLAFILCFSMTGCGNSISGKYYSEEISGVYYEFTDKDTCYLKITVDGTDKQCEYDYVIGEKESIVNKETGEVERTICLITLYDVLSEDIEELIYCFDDKSIFHSDYGLFYK